MAFHTLTVAAVQALCGDAAAVTFEVPDELRDDYAFAAGQSLALRRVVDGAEERRSYSICAPAGAAPRVGVRRVDGGLFSEWLVDRLANTAAQVFGHEPLAHVHQERAYPGRVSGTELRNPDYALLARANGWQAEAVEDTAAFEPAFRRALELSEKDGSIVLSAGSMFVTAEVMQAWNKNYS